MDAVMVLLVWAVLGLVIGAVAKFLMPGNDPGGFFVTALLGIGGAILGGYLASLIGLGSFTGFTLGGLVISVLGSILLLVAYRMVQRSA